MTAAWVNSNHPGSTRQSRKERARVLQDWPTCYLQYPGCTTVSTEDDHVIPLSQGGSNNMTNRRGACHHCHAIKTQAEARAARRSEQRDPEQHPGLA